MDWRDTVTWYTYETTFIRVAKIVVGFLLRPLDHVECVGLDNLPADGPCIVAVNHVSGFDVIYMGLYLPRHPHFMAKIELYRYPLLSLAIRLGGSFPVNRGEGDAWALKQAGRILAAGQILCMFPEGTRSGRKAQLKRGKVGTVKLALEYKVPIVPVAILGTQNFRLSLRHKNQISIKFDKPLDVAAMAGEPPYKHETLRELTTVLMRRIAAMLPPAQRGQYG